jgi:biotin synthase-like enzyme
MGEAAVDRVDMLVTLANLPEHPESVPINMLIPIPGTPLAKADPIDPLAFVRTIALARIMMPRSFVRLSAGRSAMTDEMQALCFFAGANSIFVGDTLLTAGNRAKTTTPHCSAVSASRRSSPARPERGTGRLTGSRERWTSARRAPPAGRASSSPPRHLSAPPPKPRRCVR